MTLRRSDLEELEFAVEADSRSYSRAGFDDASDVDGAGTPEDRFPRGGVSVGPYVALGLFDPDDPLRGDIGLQVNAGFTPTSGLIFSSQLQRPVLGNLDEFTRESNSVIQRVRSDVGRYQIESDIELSHLPTAITLLVRWRSARFAVESGDFSFS